MCCCCCCCWFCLLLLVVVVGDILLLLLLRLFFIYYFFVGLGVARIISLCSLAFSFARSNTNTHNLHPTETETERATDRASEITELLRTNELPTYLPTDGRHNPVRSGPVGPMRFPWSIVKPVYTVQHQARYVYRTCRHCGRTTLPTLLVGTVPQHGGWERTYARPVGSWSIGYDTDPRSAKVTVWVTR